MVCTSTCVFPVGAAVLVSLNLQNSPYGFKQLQIQGRTAFPTTETYAMWNAHTILFFYFAENSHFLRSGKFCNVTSKSALLFFNIAGATFLQEFMQYGLCF